MKYADLSGKQKRLHAELMRQTAFANHAAACAALVGIEADAKDKAAVAEVLGGVGAGDRFRQRHVSMRSKCRNCPNDIEYIDGVRYPAWVHADRIGHGHPQLEPIVPRDQYTVLVFESASR